ncbi:MAGE-like protein 2 [Drosophila innubila]|uniref:MAGE-like protein 2 n=1 Tax=Drosophila innubila TaxID=198719 RepID=UPI00148DB2BC|nr:MAGE-like protein 2 [Drosophila innubila]
MIGFIIGISIGFTIFFVISAVVVMKRRRMGNQNVGYIINDSGTRVVAPVGIPQTHYQRPGVPVTHYTPAGVPVTHYTQAGVPVTHYTQGGVPVVQYPPPSYQPNVYPHPTSSQVTVQLTATPSTYSPNQPPQQRVLSNGNTPGAEISALPSNDEKKNMQQTHEGAVETVSQI